MTYWNLVYKRNVGPKELRLFALTSWEVVRRVIIVGICYSSLICVTQIFDKCVSQNTMKIIKMILFRMEIRVQVIPLPIISLIFPLTSLRHSSFVPPDYLTFHICPFCPKVEKRLSLGSPGVKLDHTACHIHVTLWPEILKERNSCLWTFLEMPRVSLFL